MAVDIQAAIDAITSDNFPAWTVLLGIGAYSEENLLDETEFYEHTIDDKSNSIPTARLTFKDKTADELQDAGIRIYLDGVKKFTGKIKKCSNTYRTNQVTVDCVGIVTEFQDCNITEVRDLKGVKSSEIITDYLTPENWEVEIDTDSNDYILNYRLESGNFLQHINEICILNYWEWWVEEEDSTSEISTRKLMIASRRGIETPAVTLTLESTAYDAIIDKDKDKLKNTVLVSGSSSQASNMSTTASGFFTMGDSETATAMGYLIGSESCLSQPVAVGDTTIYLYDVSGYHDSGTLQIDDEEITYSASDTEENTLTITAATAAHEPDTPVLKISLMQAYVPESVMNDSKLIWIGNELVQYGSVDYWGLHDLVRGYTYNENDTPAYAHGDGTKIFSGENSLLVPADESSIGSWGQKDSRVSNIGSTDRDGLDKYGTSILLNSQKYEQFGSFLIVIDALSTLVIGDAFYLQEYGTETKVLRRCMGLKFAGDIVSVTFGLNEDYILNQFDSLQKIGNSTYVKQDLNDSQEVLETSSDGTAAKVLDKNGNEIWVSIR